jgi:hypothetical protein
VYYSAWVILARGAAATDVESSLTPRKGKDPEGARHLAGELVGAWQQIGGDDPGARQRVAGDGARARPACDLLRPGTSSVSRLLHSGFAPIERALNAVGDTKGIAGLGGSMEWVSVGETIPAAFGRTGDPAAVGARPGGPAAATWAVAAGEAGDGGELARQPLVLTDDEVVAIATDRGTFWPGALPTVDAHSVECLAAASFRGHRSLLVRSLLDETGRPSHRLQEMAGVLAGRCDVLVAYLGDDNLQRSGWGPASTHRAEGGRWLQESISPVGAHVLAWRTADSQREYLQELLLAAISAGPVGDDRHGEREREGTPAGLSGPRLPAWLCVAVPEDDAVHVVAAQKDRLLRATTTRPPTGPERAVPEPGPGPERAVPEARCQRTVLEPTWEAIGLAVDDLLSRQLAAAVPMARA